MIRLIAGSGGAYGGGHRTRMETLHSLLVGRGRLCELILCEDEAEIRRLTGDSVGLVVLDARDFSAREFSARVIALDNRSDSRRLDRSSIYYDTIPHPEAQDVLANCLIDPALTALAARTSPGQDAFENREILVYAGRQDLPGFLEEYLSSNSHARVFRELEMPRAAFLDRLARAAAVVSYFGMTILEAMYLRKPAAIFSINSGVHDRLSVYLEERCGVRLVRSIPELVSALAAPPSRCIPGQNGYQRLVDLIERTAEAV